MELSDQEVLDTVISRIYQSLPSISYFVALKNARTTANFTAIFVTNQCVNNAKMNIHQKTPETKSHEVVPYLPGKRKPPVEKCKEHSSKDIDMI